jgi:hypothetical protein
MAGAGWGGDGAPRDGAPPPPTSRRRRRVGGSVGRRDAGPAVVGGRRLGQRRLVGGAVGRRAPRRLREEVDDGLGQLVAPVPVTALNGMICDSSAPIASASARTRPGTSRAGSLSTLVAANTVGTPTSARKASICSSSSLGAWRTSSSCTGRATRGSRAGTPR